MKLFYIESRLIYVTDSYTARVTWVATMSRIRLRNRRQASRVNGKN